MYAQLKKEFRILTYTLIAPVTVGAILSVIFLYFIFNNLIAASSDMAAPMNAAASIALSFTVPFLTMRSFAEEKRQRTDQLFLTSPISALDVVLGKFFSFAAVLFIPSLIAALLPFILLPFGRVQLLYCYTCIAAFYLYALMICSLGMLISALTSNQFASGIISLLVFMLGVMMKNAYGSISPAPLRTVLSAVFNFGDRISRMMNGVFDLCSVVYFISLTILFLFICTQILLKRLYNFKNEGRKIGIYSTLTSVFILLTVIVVNKTVSLLPENIIYTDVTETKLYSITDKTKELLSSIDDEISIYYLAAADDDNPDLNVKRVLEDYESFGKKIRLEYIDPVLNPRFYADYTETELPKESVIVVNKTTQKSEAVSYDDMVKTAINPSNLSRYVTGYDVEGRITDAVQLVSDISKNKTKVLMTSGHGEVELEEDFLEVFKRRGLEIQNFDLTKLKNIEDNTAFVFMNCASKDISKEELDVLSSYLEKGGNLFLISDYNSPESLPNMEELLSFYDVKRLHGLVIETDKDGYYYSGDSAAPFYIFPLICPDILTEGIKDSKLGSIFVPLSLSYEYESKGKEIIQHPLLISSDKAYLKKDFSLSDYEYENGDITGTQILALRTDKTVGNKNTSTAVFFGSAQIFTKEADSKVSNGMNLRLFTNTVNLLGGSGASYVSIPPKNYYESLNIRASAVIYWSSVLLGFVLLVWISGIYIFLKRRKH